MAKSVKTGKFSQKMTFSNYQVVLFVLVFGLLGGYVLATSFAARVGSGATLSATPNPSSSGTSVVFTGCGYTPNVGTSITVHGPTAVSFFGAMADTSGCIDSSSSENFAPTTAGSYYVTASQASQKGTHKNVILADTTLTVN